MNSRFSWLPACVIALLLAACGSGPISMGDAGETGDGDGDGDGPEALACFDEGGLVPGALRLDPAADRAWLIDKDSERELELSSGGSQVSLVGVGVGELIAVARNDGAFGDEHSIVHVYARSSGELLRIHELAGHTVTRLWANDAGQLVASVSPQSPAGLLLTQDTQLGLSNHEPMAAPANGFVAAHEIGPEGTRDGAGWVSLDGLGWQPVSPAPLQVYDVRVADDDHTLEYTAEVDGVLSFVRARPGEAEVIALPIPSSNPSLYRPPGGGWRYRIVRNVDTETMEMTHVRVDLEAGEAVLVTPEPPPGWSFFDCYARNVAVDSDGRVYFELRDDAGAHTWAYAPEDDSWTQVGFELGLVDDMDVSSASNDVLTVYGMAQFNTYCPTNEWSVPADDALVGDSTQLIRRAPAVGLVLPAGTWNIVIDEQQRCAASLGPSGWEVRALDGSNELRELGPELGTWVWLD